MSYPEMPSATGREEQMLEYWEENDTFQKTQERDGETFVFFEGPPTANGKPGLHHLLSRTFKDLVCRFQTMLGKRVVRKAGWDTHGLPVELEAEQKLDVSSKQEVEELGLEAFQQACRESVFTYRKDWEELSQRVGYWLDYDNPYMTCAQEYMESVWWALSKLWEKGLMYRGHKSLPWCPRCETGLSSHEVAQGYQTTTDRAVVVGFPLENTDAKLLAWTTTPWTLTANVGLAVDPEAEYARVRVGEQTYVLASSRVEEVLGEEAEVLETLLGRQLTDQRVRRPLPEWDDHTEWGRVVSVDWLDLEEGTGVVHLAPAHGPEDHEAAQEHDLPTLQHVQSNGHFPETMPGVGGLSFQEANPVVVKALRQKGRLLSSTPHTHEYPHCWRCEHPLLHLARPSWYLKTSQLRKEMLDRNNAVDWHPPEVGEGRMGEWLQGNVDWALSRDRYWGTPLPVWVCSEQKDHVQVLESRQELARWSNRPVCEDTDLHRPEVDRHQWSCPHENCSGQMTRDPAVVDVWLDSGAMPFAQWGYPHQGGENFREQASANFVCEGVDQTRGWFYSLQALSTLLEHPLPYKQVLVCGLLLDENGEKMSKSKGNAVDPWEALNTHGADLVRWHLATASDPWKATRYQPDKLQEDGRKMFGTLENVYRLFRMYVDLEDFQPDQADPVAQRSVLDRWLVSRLETLTRNVCDRLQDLDVQGAAGLVETFVVEELSNWYVRLSRRRFWGVRRQADPNAFATLREALLRVSQLMAPFTPFMADWLWQALGKEGSVHLSTFSDFSAQNHRPELEQQMQAARTLASLGRSAREKTGWNLRQPLPTLWVLPHEGDLTLDPEVAELLKKEVNVKQLDLNPDRPLVSWSVKPNFEVLGPRLGGQVQQLAEKLAELTPERVRQARQNNHLEVELEDETLELTNDELDFRSHPREGFHTTEGLKYTVAVENEVSDRLWEEGARRELVSQLQQLRKDLGMNVETRVRMTLALEGRLRKAVQENPEEVAQDLLAREFHVVEQNQGPGGSPEKQFRVRGFSAVCWLNPMEE